MFRFSRVGAGGRRARVVGGLAAAGAAVVSMGVPALAQPSFQRIGGLPGLPPSSAVYGLSGDGTTVIGGTGSTEPGSWRPFRWRADTGMEQLVSMPTLPSQTIAYGTSYDGDTVAGHFYNIGANSWEAFRWTESGGFVNLGDLPGGDVYSRGLAVSGDGSAVAGIANEHTGVAFRWTQEAGMEGLGSIYGVGGSFGTGISGDGSVVVGYSDNPTTGGPEGFRWTQETGMVGLGNGPGHSTFPSAVSADGSTIVGRMFLSAHPPVVQAFRWTQETGYTLLGPAPGAEHSTAADVSADGSVIVGNHGGGWIWTEATGMRSIHEVFAELQFDLSEFWSLGTIRGISDDGRTIVGTGTNRLGFSEGWIAVIPGPGTAGVMAGAALGWGVVGGRRRGRRGERG